MKKIFLSIGVTTTTVCCALFGHLAYLYVHPECGVKDFSYSYDLLPEENFSVSSEDKMLAEKILKQKFFYLARGKQMTAYESEDHKYVIKFFNPRAFVKHEWFKKWKTIKRISSMKWLSDAYLKRKDRLKRLSKRHILAYNDLKDESGLIYVHINKNTQIDCEILVQDQDLKTYSLDLSNAFFVLQDKVVLAFEYLDDQIKKGDSLEVKTALSNLADLFVSRAKKGYTDRIQTLHNNYGFVGNRPVQIDIGRIVQPNEENSISAIELTKIYNGLEQSISQRYPELQIFVSELFKEKISSYNP